MKQILLPGFIYLLLSACSIPKQAVKPQGFEVRCTLQDQSALSDYLPELNSAKRRVEFFFREPFPRSFTVVIHPSRAAMDSCWQQDWKMPDFHSECWMVASGVAAKLDLLSPLIWEKSACEHQWQDVTASTRLMAHEMTHVYHGQHNASPDFSDTDRIDWFVEGLAVYASGQCDSTRLAGVRHWLKEHPVPVSLDQFWSGPQKYGLSGSMVMYVDQYLGRKKLGSLLVFNKKDDLLKAIGIPEDKLLADWRKWLMG